MFSSSKLFRAPAPAYFRISDGFSSDFILKLEDPATILTARLPFANTEGPPPPMLHVTGIIVKERACWNPGYSFHYDPRTVSFFEYSMEVCDATFQYVEEHLQEAGGAFLPGLRLCPWGSFVAEEIQPPVC